MSEMKNALDIINSRLYIAEEMITELKTQQQKLCKNNHRKNINLKNEQNISGFLDKLKKSNYNCNWKHED